MIKRASLKIELNYGVSIYTAIVVLGSGTAVWASDADYNFLVESPWRSCQQIGSKYQEVYAFETPNFYVNICQKEGAYFYSGEAKQTNASSIFIPAAPLQQSHGFKANNGNVSYVVILPFSTPVSAMDVESHPEAATLTIERNNRLVSIESSLTKYCQQSEAIAFEELKLNSQSLNHLAAITQPQDISRELLSQKPATFLPAEIVNFNSHFDFYRINGEIHRLATCS